MLINDNVKDVVAQYLCGCDYERRRLLTRRVKTPYMKTEYVSARYTFNMSFDEYESRLRQLSNIRMFGENVATARNNSFSVTSYHSDTHVSVLCFGNRGTSHAIRSFVCSTFGDSFTDMRETVCFRTELPCKITGHFATGMGSWVSCNTPDETIVYYEDSSNITLFSDGQVIIRCEPDLLYAICEELLKNCRSLCSECNTLTKI